MVEVSRRQGFVAAATAACSVALVVTAAWWWAGAPREAGPPVVSGKFNSLSFAPYRDGESPISARFPTAAEAEADMATVAPITRSIRTYAALEGDWVAAEIAARHGLTVLQGIWLSSDRAANDLEIQRGIDLANSYPGVVTRVVVGNEVLLRKDLSEAELEVYIDRVKSAVHQPVTYADVWEFWEKYPTLAAHVDIVTVHLLPYWEDSPTGISDAVAHVRDSYRRMVDTFPTKPVAIGEAGWPSRGRQRMSAVPSPTNEARFVREFVALSQREGFDYNLIEAFDQGWKYQNEGVVGANWGIIGPNRLAKFSLQGKVSDIPSWAALALGSIIVGLVLAAFGVLAGGRSHARPVFAGVIAMVLGAAIGLAWWGSVPEALDTFLLVAAIGNILFQGLLAILCVLAVAGHRLPSLPAIWTSRLGISAGVDIGYALTFCFAWTAACECLFLIVDSRYREFPVGAFGVPLIAAWVFRPTRSENHGGVLVSGSLIIGAGWIVAAETLQNAQAIAWSLTMVGIAIPLALQARMPSLREWLPTGRAILTSIPAAIAVSAIVAFRSHIVEPQDWASACVQAIHPTACLPRAALLWMQTKQVWGDIALGVGVLTFLLPRAPRWLCAVALAWGIAAVTNYNATFGILGSCLAGYAWVFRSPNTKLRG